MVKLRDLAAVIRSKNASPFVTALDVFFDDPVSYSQVKGSGSITKESIARLYRLPIDDVLGVWFVDACLGIKISYLKPQPSDDPQAGDLYGAQQNAPLLDLDIEATDVLSR